jgi:hypothetical protein
MILLLEGRPTIDLEKVVQMGMEQGMMATLEKLDELLLTINK